MLTSHLIKKIADCFFSILYLDIRQNCNNGCFLPSLKCYEMEIFSLTKLESSDYHYRLNISLSNHVLRFKLPRHFNSHSNATYRTTREQQTA